MTLLLGAVTCLDDVRDHLVDALAISATVVTIGTALFTGPALLRAEPPQVVSARIDESVAVGSILAVLVGGLAFAILALSS